MPDITKLESVAPPAVATPIISKRALQRLAEMQHTLTAEMRLLHEQHSRFLGALMACDAATQQSMLLEYRDQLHSVHTIIAKLRLLLERFFEDHNS